MLHAWIRPWPLSASKDVASSLPVALFLMRRDTIITRMPYRSQAPTEIYSIASRNRGFGWISPPPRSALPLLAILRLADPSVRAEIISRVARKLPLGLLSCSTLLPHGSRYAPLPPSSLATLSRSSRQQQTDWKWAMLAKVA